MRRFRFRLESLLRVRSQVERTARKALAAAMAEVHTFDQQIEAASRGLADCEEQAARADSVGHLARGLEDGLRRHRWRLVRAREQAEQRLEVVRVEYTEKARELKTLQRLRDQEYELWKTETLRAEQAELDELAVLTRGGGPGEETW
jgi:flagellar export protein FliJ